MKIELYISGKKADLSEDSQIVYNYIQDNQNNPTIVRNSFSCSLTLPVTPANNAIFGHFKRLDRETSVGRRSALNGAYFDATRKVSFTIYKGGEILESGYVKLEKTTKSGYEISLYGSLGSFLYGLKYNEDGTQRTMADLNYLTGGASELTFTCNASNLADAWQHIGTGKWGVINFAPCYNGIPENFDADKVLIKVADYSTIVPTTAGGLGARNGFALATMSEKVDEWKMRDLRSYLQRPVYSVGAALVAISNTANNGGWTIDWQNTSVWFARNSWVTLPLMNDRDDYSQVTKLSSIRCGSTKSPVAYDVLQRTYTKSVRPNRRSSGSGEVSATFRVTCSRETSLANAYLTVLQSGTNFKAASEVYQVIGKAADGSILAYSPIYAMVSSATGHTAESIANLVLQRCVRSAASVPDATSSLGYFYAAPGSTGSIVAIDGHFVNGVFVDSASNDYLDLTLTGYGIDSYEIRHALVTPTGGGSASQSSEIYAATASGTTPVKASEMSSYALYEESVTRASIRTGAIVTKADLLNTSYSPADFLVGLGRLLGWYFVCDKDTKKITVYDRDGFYLDADIDLTERIDASSVETAPLMAETKYYDIAYPESYGAIAEAYKEKTEREYASIRVNTGYEFGEEPENLLDGLVFKGATMYLDRSKMYTFPVKSSKTYFGWQMLTTKYTFGDKATATADTTVNGIVPASYNQFNTKGIDYADIFGKVQLCDAEGKPESGEGVLLFRYANNPKPVSGNAFYQLSDDTTEMFYQNDNTPCWILSESNTWVSASAIPQFRRAFMSNNVMTSNALVQNSWDIMPPAENYDVNFPSIDESLAIYPWRWKSFIADRYDRDTRVVTAKVDFSGMTIGEELFRHFYYFGGTIWVLNRISDYVVGGDSLVKCEFIRVQDKNNYE